MGLIQKLKERKEKKVKNVKVDGVKVPMTAIEELSNGKGDKK